MISIFIFTKSNFPISDRFFHSTSQFKQVKPVCTLEAFWKGDVDRVCMTCRICSVDSFGRTVCTFQYTMSPCAPLKFTASATQHTLRPLIKHGLLEIEYLTVAVVLRERRKGFSNRPGQVSLLDCSKWDVLLAKDNDCILTKDWLSNSSWLCFSGLHLFSQMVLNCRKSQCLQRLNWTSTITVAQLCSIYIFNILPVFFFKCWFDRLIANILLLHQQPHRLLSWRGSGHPDRPFTGEISWFGTLVNDWSGNLGEEEQAISPSHYVIVTCLIRQIRQAQLKGVREEVIIAWLQMCSFYFIRFRTLFKSQKVSAGWKTNQLQRYCFGGYS